MSVLSMLATSVRKNIWSVLPVLTIPLVAQDVPAHEQPHPYESVADPALKAAALLTCSAATTV
jgi:hypothetical protein